MNKKMRSYGLILIALTVVLTLIFPEFTKAVESENSIEETDIPTTISEDYIAFDEEGNITITPIEEVETVDQESLSELNTEEGYQVVAITGYDERIVEEVETLEEANEVVETLEQMQSMSRSATSTTYEVQTRLANPVYGVIDFKYMGNGVTSPYTNAQTGYAGYLYAPYAPDAAYLGMVGDKVKFMQAGVIGLIDQEYIGDITEYDTYIKDGWITSTYTVKNGKIYHNISTNLEVISSTQIVGYQQSYMNDNATYYSYDGHYFYTSYKTMVTDYKNGTFKNSINPNTPYYNYYQFLSHRTQTSFTATQIEQFIDAKTNTSSKLNGLGDDFVTHQNTYGINATLMLGVAVNESGWGYSYIANSKNNLFGHGAYDSNPAYGANGYTSAGESIKYHAQTFLSAGYLDASDWRYLGPHVGNKESGINVKYASDSYWGEKAAAISYLMEDYFSSKTYDYGNYKIGIVSGDIPVYQSANTSKLLYSTGNSYATINEYTLEMGVVIIGETTDSSGTKWYKIQTDTSLNSSRTAISPNSTYSFSRDYGYMKASNVDVVTYSDKYSGDTGGDSTLRIGDPSGDGKITSLDYVLVRNHIMKTIVLSGKYYDAADPSGDGKITSLDYVLIRNHITGTIVLD